MHKDLWERVMYSLWMVRRDQRADDVMANVISSLRG